MEEEKKPKGQEEQEEGKSRLSPQEERKFANLAKRFLRQSSVAIKNFRMFGNKHPVIENNIKNIYELLEISLGNRESITYTFLEGMLLVEDVKLKDIDPKAYAILPELKECSVTSLGFLAGIQEKEVATLLETISLGTSHVKAEGGLAAIFRAQKIEHIKVDETFFKRVSKKEEEEQKAKNELADMLVVDFFLGKSSFSKGDKGMLAQQAALNPQKMGKLISETAFQKAGKPGKGEGPGGGAGEGPGGGAGKGPGGGAGKGPGSGGDGSPAGFAQESIKKLASSMQDGGMSADEMKKNAANIILSLDAPLRGDVLRNPLKEGETGNIIKDAMAEFSDKIAIDLIVADYEENKSIVETRQLIRRLMPDQKRREKLMPTLEKTLLRKGVSHEVYEKLSGGKFWEDMSLTEKTQELKEKPPEYCMELGIKEEIIPLLVDLLGGKKFDLIEAAVTRIMCNLSVGSSETKVRFIREFEQIAIFLFRADEYPDRDKFLKKIQEEYEKITEKEVRERFLNLAAHLVEICMENKWYAYMTPLIRAVGYESVKDKMGKETTLAGLMKTLLFESKMDEDVVRDLADAIGEEAQKAMCEILLSLDTDDFDSFRKRQEIADMAKELGGVAETFFADKVKSGETGEIKIAMEILSEVGTKNSLATLKAALGHPDERIRGQAERTIAKIEKRETDT